MIICTVVVEYVNVQTNAHKLKGFFQTGIYQSCLLFSEETFIRDTGGKAPKEYFPVLTGTYKGDNSTINAGAKLDVQQMIYGGKTTESDIWNYLYYNTDSSYTWGLDSLRAYNIQQFADGTQRGLSGSITNANDTPVAPKDYFINLSYLVSNNPIFSEIFRGFHYTPMNIGVPYLDPITVTGMSQWAVTELLSEGIKNTALDTSANDIVQPNVITNLHRDGNGVYVLWKGFRIYVGQLTVQVNYKLLDMTSSEDRKVYSDALHISADTVFDSATRFTGETDEVTSSILNEKYAMVAYVDYSVPVSYEGITPWRRMVSWIMAGGYNADENSLTTVDSYYTNSSGDTLHSSTTDGSDTETQVYTTGKKVTGGKGYTDPNYTQGYGDFLAYTGSTQMRISDLQGGGLDGQGRSDNQTTGKTGRIVFAITK